MKKTRAITLIEVVAALILLATTATSLVLAHSRSLLQLQTTMERATAERLANELIAEWRLEDAQIIAPRGTFADHVGWRWERSQQPYRGTDAKRLAEITLRLYRAPRDTERLIVTYTWIQRDHESLENR